MIVILVHQLEVMMMRKMMIIQIWLLGNPTGSPWVASSGASRQDIWGSVNIDYSHSSDNRNTIWNADASFATEFDYSSIGFGGGLTKLFNEKNTTIRC